MKAPASLADLSAAFPCEHCEHADARRDRALELLDQLLRLVPMNSYLTQPQQNVISDVRELLVAAGRRVEERKMWEDR